VTETPDEQPTDAEETPADDAAPEETPAEAEEAPAGEVASEDAPAEEPAGDAAEADEAPAAEADEAPAADAEAPADEEPAAEVAEEAPAAPEQEAGEAEAEESKPAEKPAVPGADLEPIAIGEERELTAEERARAEAEEEERAAREARAAQSDDDDEAIAPRAVSVPDDAQIQATGKRKSAVARVIVRSGSGAFHVNDRPLEQYFPSTQHQSLARQPLVASGYDSAVDVRVRVHGGGISGQAGAVRHGVARALTDLEPELRGELKRRGLLTRDDRRKERKKAGLKKARKRPQFSKR
jgi:small subunit ribosomal protein S9